MLLGRPSYFPRKRQIGTAIQYIGGSIGKAETTGVIVGVFTVGLTLGRIYGLKLFPFQHDQTLEQFAVASIGFILQLLFKPLNVFCGYPMCLVISLPHDRLRVIERECLTRFVNSGVSQPDPISYVEHWLISQRESQPVSDGLSS